MKNIDAKTVSEEILIEEGTESKIYKLHSLKKILRGKISILREMPELSLIEYKIKGKRQGGILSSQADCIIIQTKEYFLHILYTENDKKPGYSFNMGITQSKITDWDNTVVEIVENKQSTGFLSKLKGTNWCRIEFSNEKLARDLNSRINSVTNN